MGAGSPRSKQQHSHILVKALLVHSQHLLTMSCCGGKDKDPPGASFIQALIPFMRTPAS